MAEKVTSAASDTPDFEHWGPPYVLPENPTYDANVPSITTQTPVHADVMNAQISRLVENTEAVKRIADGKASPEPAGPGKDGLLAAADKEKYDGTASTVETLVQHYPVNGVVGGDFEGTFPNPTIKADAVASKAIEFVWAAARANIASGQSMQQILGMLARWYADLKEVAFSGNYNDLSNRPASFPPAAHRHDDIYYTQAQNNNLLAGKAAASHTHSAGNITSGVLPVARGGTGVAGTGSVAPVNADMVDGWHRDDLRNWNNLLNRPATFTPSSHTHTASQISDLTISQGTWSPTFSAFSTYEVQQGFWTKIGNTVICDIRIKGQADAGYALSTGSLPWECKNGRGGAGSMHAIKYYADGSHAAGSDQFYFTVMASYSVSLFGLDRTFAYLPSTGTWYINGCFIYQAR